MGLFLCGHCMNLLLLNEIVGVVILSIKLGRFQICQPCLKYPEKQVISNL
jgi:hypothetical protein